jgi:hypothetical protein
MMPPKLHSLAGDEASNGDAKSRTGTAGALSILTIEEYLRDDVTVMSDDASQCHRR